jgi:hypothetical protein
MKNSFLGIGAEKSASSWIFACLYEHPEICIPVKEFNFFTEESLYTQGLDFYNTFYNTRCKNPKIVGEYSTEYLSSEIAPKRIYNDFPDVKLIVCLRNPIDRAFSNYMNDIMAGAIDSSKAFSDLMHEREYLSKGNYKNHLERYLEIFPREQIYISLYDDIQSDAKKFIKKLFQFLNVNDTFIPKAIDKKYNVSRMPANVNVDKLSNKVAKTLQSFSAGEKIWYTIKKTGIVQKLRNANTDVNKPFLSPEVYNSLIPTFQKDILFVENLLNRKLDWGIEKET